MKAMGIIGNVAAHVFLCTGVFIIGKVIVFLHVSFLIIFKVKQYN